MKSAFLKSFTRDLDDIKNPAVLAAVKACIKNVQNAVSINDIANIRKMRGGRNFYRIRVGDYRIGIAIQNNTVRFVRCLNRAEIYRHFP